MFVIEKREKALQERLERLNLKMTSPSKYFSNIISEMENRAANQKEVKRQAKSLVQSQRMDHTRVGLEKMRMQMGRIEEEIDSLRMPIVDEFKVILLKQRANAYRRTVQGKIERDINVEVVLPKISKQVERQRRLQQLKKPEPIQTGLNGFMINLSNLGHQRSPSKSSIS